MGAQNFDVAVVGASLAGCTAATLLGRQGARVALIERRPDPAAYKVMCTHYIQASATPVLERLGLTEPIEAAGGLRNGLEVWSRDGWVRPDPGPDYPHPAYGYDIRREKLDPMVRELAMGTPGVQAMLGQTVTDLVRDHGRPAGVKVADRRREEREVTARVVIGADGRDSSVARLAGVKARVKPHGRFGYFAHYRNLPLVSGDRTLFWFLDPDIAYAFPQDDGITLLAIFQTKDRMSWFKRDVEANFENTFRGLPNAPDLDQGERVSKVMGRLDVPNTMRPAASDGLAFAGDAAMAADPVWGVGCGFALQSAEWLAGELGPVLGASGQDGDIDRALCRYAKMHRRRLLGHYLMMADFSTGRRMTPIERMIWGGGARDAAVADSFHAFGGRLIRPTDPAFAKMVAGAARARIARSGQADVQPLAGQHAEGTTLPATVRRTRMSVGGVEVPMSSCGSAEDSEAVVFVHGNPGSSRDWDDLLSRTGSFARGIAFDMPGFGRADKPQDFDYTVEGYARFLGSALEQVGVEKVHLVLHDFGGPWGLEWASHNPERVASAVLINTGVLLDYSWHYLARIWRTPVLGELFQATTTRSALRLVLRHGNPRGLPRAFVDRMYDDMDAGTRRAILKLYRATTDPAAAARRQADALRPFDIPALVVWGANDPYLPVALAERQRDVFPRAEISILEQSGHWPFADDPDGVGRAVDPFLRRCVSAEREVAPI
jgi:2-polyprenyl-6-methoxyphenol hydroxylase-like FAD-dependent oxidoreductase/pimeloyl-ACP methyl ester carboxylesterase